MSASVDVRSHESVSRRPIVLVVDDEEGVRAFFVRCSRTRDIPSTSPQMALPR